MTDRATLLPLPGSADGSAGAARANARVNALGDAISRHVGCETASFHTPGHKGRTAAGTCSLLDDYPWQTDLTELPGLDDLSSPEGVLSDLEKRAASIWGARQTAISVNGASAGIAAAMLALAARGSTVLVPRNAHRSVIHGLVLSGLFPIWYEPVWDDDWGFWSSVSATSAERLLERYGAELAGMIVVAPTYAGALSDLPAVAEHCRQAGVPLIVDEAHGAHFVPGTAMPASAVEVADIVVHSLHKTLPALTQTGLLHIGKQSAFDPQHLRSALRLLQSSSPSYLLMASIEQALSRVEGDAGVESLLKLREHALELRAAIADLQELKLYETPAGVDPAHILIGCPDRQPEELYDFLCERGIFPETILGQGVLFLLGLGTTAADIRILSYALTDFVNQSVSEPKAASAFAGPKPPARRPPEFTQIISPRQAFLLPSEVIPVVNSVGRIASETVAPCPPGTPLIVAGQRVPEEILDCASLQNLRVVVE